MPEVLLVGGAFGLGVVGVGVVAHEVVGVSSADEGGFHASVGGEVGGAEGESLHAR